MPRSANDVFRLLEQEGVRIALDDSCRAQAIDAIESLLKQYRKGSLSFIINIIASTAQEELLKSREIDVKIIKHVVGLILGKIRRATRERLASLKKLVEEVEVEVEDEDEEGHEDEGEEDEEDEEDKEGEGEGDGDGEGGGEGGEKIEWEMVDQIIPYLRIYKCGPVPLVIPFFMNKVREHILKSCILDHLGPVYCSLESQKLRKFERFKKEPTVSVRKLVLDFLAEDEDEDEDEDEAEAEADGKDQVHEQNILSTKEEGIATPMNQLKQEEKKRECGDVELEECEIATPLNLPDQGENMVNVNFCLTQPECEDIKTEECGISTRGGANKRLKSCPA